MHYPRITTPVLLLLTTWLLAACNNQPNLQIENAWTRSTPFAGGNTPVYLRITNRGAADQLVNAWTEDAYAAEFHQVQTENGVMHMYALESGAVDIPTRQTLALEPGGLHIMLVDLKRELNPGDTLTLALEFEQAGTYQITVEVRPNSP